MKDKTTMAGLILREMQTRNWSQRDLAKACELSNTTISKIVREQSLPDPNTCFKLAQGLGLSVQYTLELAGHQIAGAQTAPPTLESFLHAQFAALPDRAIQEMIGAIRNIERTYTTPSAQDLAKAQLKLQNAELVRRWLDPVKYKVLTVVQGGHFLFYQTADLDTEGCESNHSDLLPVQEDLSGLSMFPVYNFANSFCVQLYPLAEFEAHRCQSHQQHATLFAPLYAGDRGTGVLIIYPDGQTVIIRDQMMERVWQRIYNDMAADRDLFPFTPSVRQQERLRQVQHQWQERGADELWINPDARTWAAFFQPIQDDTSYYLVTGPLAQVDDPNWRAQSASRIEIVDTTLYGRFETSVLHLQGFCIRLCPSLEHLTATRHIVPAHRTLFWSQGQVEHVVVMNEYLGTWLHLHVWPQQMRIHIAEDMTLRAEMGRRKLERLIQELEGQGSIPGTWPDGDGLN